MKRLQITSLIILIIGVIYSLLWQFVFPIPDWFVRITGLFIIISLFTLTFSSVKLYISKK